MKTIETPPTALDAEWEAAVERAMKGLRDPKAMDEAARAMDEGREQLRLAVTDVAAELTDPDDE